MNDNDRYRLSNRAPLYGCLLMMLSAAAAIAVGTFALGWLLGAPWA